MTFRKTKPRARAPRQTRQAPASRREFFSYHASRQSFEAQTAGRQMSPVRKKLPFSLNWQRVPAMLALLVLLVCVVYSTILSSKAKFVLDTPAGTKPLRSINTYQQEATIILNSSLFNKNKLTVNTTKLSQQMEAQFPELSGVSVILPLMGHRPLIEATVDKPALLIASNKGVFVVGQSGKVLIKTSDIKGAGDLAIPTVRDEADLSIEPGKGALSSQDVTFITTVVRQFEAKNISIASLELPTLASELYIHITGQPYYVKFSLLTDPRIATGQFFALKKNLEVENITPAEYIDSRVEERVFYK